MTEQASPAVETRKAEVIKDVRKPERRRTGYLSLDLPIRQTLFLYVLLLALIGRYTLFSWFGAGGADVDRFAALRADPAASLTATFAALFIHLMPFHAYRKAKRLEEDLDSEKRVGTRLLDRATDLASSQSAELDRQGIDTLYRRHFANLIGAGDAKTAAARILEDVLNRARMLRFESTTGLVAPYRAEFVSRLPEIAKYQRIALQLGIMSTFFGLMMVFSGSAFSSSITSSNVSAMAAQLIGGLNLAFGGSVAGLIASIVVILFLDHLRHDLVAVGRLHERLAEQATAVAHRAFNDPALRDNLSALENVLKRTEGQLGTVQRELSASNRASAALQASVEQSAPQMAASVGRLDHSLRQLGERNEQLIETILAGYDRLTPDQLGDHIYRALSKGVEETGRQLQQTTEMIASLRATVGEIEAAYASSRTDSIESRRLLRKVERELARLKSPGRWQLPAWFKSPSRR